MTGHGQEADQSQPKEVELAGPVPASQKESPPSWLCPHTTSDVRVTPLNLDLNVITYQSGLINCMQSQCVSSNSPEQLYSLAWMELYCCSNDFHLDRYRFFSSLATYIKHFYTCNQRPVSLPALEDICSSGYLAQQDVYCLVGLIGTDMPETKHLWHIHTLHYTCTYTAVHTSSSSYSYRSDLSDVAAMI